MTFTQMQARVASRLNLTSSTALTRIGEDINEVYKEIATSLGMATVARGPVSASTVVGNRSVTFGPTPTAVEKLYHVFKTAAPVPHLQEIPFDELRECSVRSGTASRYAIQLMDADHVTILLDATPTAIYGLTADADCNLVALATTAVPKFPEAFHNAIVYGAMVIELEKMEKYDMSKIIKQRYEMRCADLRFYIAKTAHLEFYQHKAGGSGVPWPSL